MNSFLLLLILLIVGLGCGSSGSGNGQSQGYSPNVERGRLKFAKSVTSLNIGRDPIYRDVRQAIYVDGKEWSPADDNKFADKINWCDTSPNLESEMLRCFGTDYKSTYLLLIKNDKPELQKIDEGVGSVWLDDDGRWLLFRKLYYNVETGEKIAIKGMPFADDDEGSAPVQYVIGVSPDMKTVVAMPDSSRSTEGAEEFVTLWVINTETGDQKKRKVSFTKNSWLKDYKQPENDIQPPLQASKKFVWEEGADSRDKIVMPQLLEK